MTFWSPHKNYFDDIQCILLYNNIYVSLDPDQHMRQMLMPRKFVFINEILMIFDIFFVYLFLEVNEALFLLFIIILSFQYLFIYIVHVTRACVCVVRFNKKFEILIENLFFF